MIALDITQQSEEWYKQRAGRPSASNFDMLITTKGEPSKQAEKYMHTLAGERLLGTKAETYQNEAMKRGTELEGEARQLYEFITGNEIKQVGICFYDDRMLYCASPDGLIEPDGCLEIKSPNMATHVGYLLKQELPTDYFQQVMGQLLCTGRQWVDFFSYYPGIAPFLIRVPRNDEFISKLKVRLESFCQELAEVETKLRSLQ
jgi:putative phage-type endonuclease